MDEKLITATELARMLQVPTGFVYRLNYEKRGPRPIRLGRRTVRYRVSDVARFISEHGQPE